MWKKRLQQNRASRQQASDTSPAGLTVGGSPYGGPQSTIVDVNRSIATPNNPSMRPPRPPREPPMGLPTLPFQAVQDPARQGENRPASSIYSQTSPNPQISKLPRLNTVARRYGEDVQISPPSSPENYAADSRQRLSYQGGVKSPEVSPIDEIPSLSQLQITQPAPRPDSRAAATSIPVLRREKRRNQIASAAANLASRKDEDCRDETGNRTSSDTRWDMLTGERTTNERGQPPQVKPSDFNPMGSSINSGAVDPSLVPRATGFASRNGQNSFVERLRQIKENHMTTTTRLEWKGSSGRAQIVPSVVDQTAIKTIDIPRKSSKRATSPRVAGSSTNTPVSTILSSHAETSNVSPSTSAYAGSMTTPTVIPQAGRSSPRYMTSPASFQPQHNVLSAPTGSSFDNCQSPAQCGTVAPATEDHQKTLTGSYQEHEKRHKREESTTSIERNFREAFKDLNLPTSSREQPVSRFSVTTYAPSTADSTPRISFESPPPMPTLSTDPTLLVDRRRPKVSGSFNSEKATVRKAVAGSPIRISMASTSASYRNSKMLPKSPPEQESVDLVSSLQAQLDNLAHRRTNLRKSIRQMTELMPTDPLARGMEGLRQAEEKKKVEILRVDLADVQREEHEIGLKLHRAWKRRDQNAIYEPTGLWVRRVTG